VDIFVVVYLTGSNLQAVDTIYCSCQLTASMGARPSLVVRRFPLLSVYFFQYKVFGSCTRLLKEQTTTYDLLEHKKTC